MPLFSRSRSKSSEQAAPAAGGGAGVSVREGMAPSTDDSELDGDGSPYKEARTLSTTSTPADEGGGAVLSSVCCCRLLSYHPASFLLFLQLPSTLLYPLVELNRLLLNLLNRGLVDWWSKKKTHFVQLYDRDTYLRMLRAPARVHSSSCCLLVVCACCVSSVV